MSYDDTKYRPGLGRSIPNPRRAHLYELGEHSMDFQNPMCRYGWNRDSGESYSIWRGNVGADGICKLCVKRASKGLSGLPSHNAYTPEDYEFKETV